MRAALVALLGAAAFLAPAAPAAAAPHLAATPTSVAAHAATAPAHATTPTPAGEQSADVVLASFDIPGGSVSNPGTVFNRFTPDVAPPCQDCDITSVTPDLTDPSGTSVNMDAGPMLHHMVLYQRGVSDVSCPGLIPTFGMRRLFASGNERTAIPEVPGYALHVDAGERWALLTDLMNYSPQPQSVQVRLHVTYQPGSALKPILPVWLDETGCGISYLTVPAGPSHQSMTWTSAVDGNVIGMGGHLHEYGQHIAATDVTTGAPLCDSQESQMTMDNGLVMVTGMSRCLGTGPDSVITRIHRGDTIRMDSYYDTPDWEFFGPMGIMIMYVYPS